MTEKLTDEQIKELAEGIKRNLNLTEEERKEQSRRFANGEFTKGITIDMSREDFMKIWGKANE